jgi:hypothetical protein
MYYPIQRVVHPPYISGKTWEVVYEYQLFATFSSTLLHPKTMQSVFKKSPHIPLPKMQDNTQKGSLARTRASLINTNRPFPTMLHTQDLSTSTSPLSQNNHQLSLFSGNYGGSSPVTMMNSSLLFPAYISCPSPITSQISSEFSEHKRLMQSFYEHQFQKLKDNLARSKQQYDLLWYV